MRSVLQDYRSGELKLIESPTPQLDPGSVLVKTAYSVISAGTEKTKVEMASKSLLGKAQARPDLVNQVIAKAKKEGLWKTWQTVQERLGAQVPLGYCSAGEVIETAGDVDGLRPGDLVACGGSSANHAEIVAVPKNLVAPVPAGVALEHAAFTTLGAIALQGVRQANVQLGEKIAVIGLGLVGLLTVQILKAAGARVFGIDVALGKLELGLKLGCAQVTLATDEALDEKILEFTGGYGVDATIITAASQSNGPVEQAARITREKGRIVVVGLTKMDLPREPFYLKELDLRLSRSYGPGRYDKSYEDEGLDYPYSYVRFTERRNMVSFLELLESGQVRLDPLITHRFPVEDAVKAYELLQGAAKEPYLGIVLEYGRKLEAIPRRVEFQSRPRDDGSIVVAVIGAGNYARANLLPYLRHHSDISLGTVCTKSGVTAATVAEKFEIGSAEADVEAAIKAADAVLIATRHDEHAAYALKALQLGKAVFVEKPLAITEEQLEEVRQSLASLHIDSAAAADTYDRNGGASRTTSHRPSLTVGFNRRFAPATEMVKAHFKAVSGPKQICIRVNAGAIPPDHWIQDPKVGGGRLIGEGCHFVDLAVALCGSLVTNVSAFAVTLPGSNPAARDSFTVTLEMENGSVTSIFYSSIGDTGLAKERIEVYGGGRAAVIDDFRRLEMWRGGKRRTKSWFSQDKGQKAEIGAWIRGLKEGRSSIPLEEILNVHAACFAVLRSIETREVISI